jgi:diguanylate cyclase (GGDEF)-like protein
MVNDLKGHHVGDLYIVRFTQALNSAIVDHFSEAFRVGGDEFVVVARKGEGKQFIERLDQAIEGEKISYCYGIESATRDTLKQALIETDKAMYRMKHSQREDR